MVAADQFLLGLGQVEGQPAGLGERGHAEDHEAQRLDEDVPDAGLGLLGDDRVQPQRAGRQHHAEDAQPQRAFRRRSTGRCSAGRRGSCTCCCWPSRPAPRRRRRCCRRRRRRSCPRPCPARPPGGSAPCLTSPKTRPAARCRRGSPRRRPSRPTKIAIGASEVQDLVDVAGRELLLEEELHAVGHRLAQAEQPDLRQRNAHAVRPQAVLHPGRDPPLHAAPDTPRPSSARRSAGRSSAGLRRCMSMQWQSAIRVGQSASAISCRRQELTADRYDNLIRHRAPSPASSFPPTS